jgi:thiamine-phosphate pyrophosphorylase
MYNKLQYISQGLTAISQLGNITQALDAGCTWIQLRFKNATGNELMPVAEQVKLMCQRYKATLIINDHVEIARRVEADGVHLGLNDISIQEARTILGDAKIIGGTANTLPQVLQRIEEKCNYIGLGPFRFTTTKEKLSPVLNIEGYHTIMNNLKSRNIHFPVYAIGGITENDIAVLMESGVYGIAVSGVITQHSSKKELVQQLNELLYVNA